MSRSSRPRGYMNDWSPQPHVALLLTQVQEVIEQYREYGAMTVRQVFYRLVGQYDYQKDERAYARLCETLVKARRAQIVDFGSIRDEPEESHRTGGYSSVAEWWRSELYHARAYRRDPHEGQNVHVELWCEAAGMAPMLAQMVRDYGVDVYSTGGFSSVTVTHSTAQRIIERAQELEGRPTMFLHVGDYDPSGESIFNAMNEDIAAFIEDETGDVDSYFTAKRVALTEAQVEQYRLPTAPPKRSDTRSNNWVGQTCQLEAMDPATLNGVLTATVEAIIDLDELDRIRIDEKVERAQLVEEVTTKIRERDRKREGGE